MRHARAAISCNVDCRTKECNSATMEDAFAMCALPERINVSNLHRRALSFVALATMQEQCATVRATLQEEPLDNITRGSERPNDL